jgi:hypothetical protein
MASHCSSTRSRSAVQVTQGEDNLGIAVGVRGVFANLEDGVVFKEPIQHIQGFPRTTGNHLGAEDRGLIRDMGIDANGFFIVAVIARIIGSQQATGANPKALGI